VSKDFFDIKRSSAIVTLLLLFVGFFGFKLWYVMSDQSFSKKDDTEMFWTEGAFQYKIAKLLAFTGGIPTHYSDAQYPEGLEIKKKITVLMESISGYIYRTFVPKNIPFHLFLAVFICFYSSFSIFPVYLLSALLWNNRFSGLLSSLFYATTLASSSSSLTHAYIKEDFSLPFIFFHLYFLILGFKRQKFDYTFLSGAFLFVGLASWHLTQFFYLIVVVFIALNFIIKENFREEIRIFSVIVLLAIFAGLLVPTLRSERFLFSNSMLLSYLLVILGFSFKKASWWKKLASLFFILGAGLTLKILLSPVHIKEYSHVYTLMLNKITYLGVKPEDPSSLSWEANVMWTTSFMSPSIKEIYYFFGSLFPLGIGFLLTSILRFIKKRQHQGESFLIFFSLSFSILYLLIIRMDAFLVYFLSLHTGLFSKVRRAILFILLIGLGLNLLILTTEKIHTDKPMPNYILTLIKYVRDNTEKGASFLTTFSLGPSLFAFCDRPVLLHSKFEDYRLREKVKEFEHTLFEDENTFYHFCRKYEANYFVYTTSILLSTGVESIRYRTDNLNLPKDCVAYKFHFRPEELKRFRLVYTNPIYRLYEVLEEGEVRGEIDSPYFRPYDKKFFKEEF